VSDVHVVAAAAVSALGRGEAAYRAAPLGSAARTAIALDPALEQAGFTRPFAARAPQLGVDTGDRATDLLLATLGDVCAELDAVQPGWRSLRLGVAIGTSSGGMLGAERFFAARAAGQVPAIELARSATYFAPLDDALARAGLAPSRRSQVLAACASSTVAIGLAMRWLERGACDLVLAGGYDGVGLFVAAGFESLKATSLRVPPQPFRLGRDGMALGEGAGVLALVRRDQARRTLFRVTGFGAGNDAVHITAPDREGGGLARAGRAALADAGAPCVDLVSAHGTATPYNDAAESRAVAALCTPAPVVHAFKAQIGHTLGAAGVLEVLAAADAIRTGVLPPTCGDAPLDPDAPAVLCERAERREVAAALKLSAAFGGATAALVLEAPAPIQAGAALPERPAFGVRGIRVVAHAGVSEVDRTLLAEATGLAADRLARIDDLGLLALAACAALAARTGKEALAGAGIVGGYALATLDTNERFNARLLQKGARWVDPRLFPATSPNAGIGHCAIAFGLTGPSFAVGAGLGGAVEALSAAAELVAAGDAERMVVVAADDAGPAARQWVELCAPGRELVRGAVAVLLEAGGAQPRVDLDAPSDDPRGPVGHLALRRLLER
jgi:3-oxoacyl-[acyl-carrier-protein] synthase-1/3-oxoacyl-[acyl-carrier-protein] synthase II